MMRKLSKIIIAGLVFSASACAEVEDFYDREIMGEEEPSIIGRWHSESACKDGIRVEVDFNDGGGFTVNDGDAVKGEAVFVYDRDSGILKYKVTRQSALGCQLRKSGYWEEVYINLGEDSLSIGSGALKGEYDKI